MTSDAIPIDDVLRRLRLQLPVTTENFVSAVREIMEVVETFGGATGPQKKQAVIDTLDSLLRSTDAGAPLEAVEPLVLALLPHLVDELVVCSRTGVRINRRHRRCGLGCVFTFAHLLLCRVCRRRAE